jgi:fatty-acyl-CoA synthase
VRQAYNFDFKIDYDFLKNEFPHEVYEWVYYWAQKDPQRLVIVDCDKKEFNYRQLLHLARVQAVNLYELGVGPGDRIATLEMNSLDHFSVIIAASLLRAVLVPLNWRLKDPELLYMINDSKPQVLLYGKKYRQNSEYLKEAVKVFDLEEISCVEKFESNIKTEIFNSKIDELEKKFFDYGRLNPICPILVLYTSGTTGFPKGAMISDLQTKQNAINTIIDWGLNEGERYILSAPLFHTGGWNVLALPLLMAGGEIIIHEKFDAEAILNDIERHKVTLYFGVPTMFISMMESMAFSSVNMSSIKFFISGGAPCPPYIIETFSRKGVIFRQGFGLTEVGPNCFTLPCEDAVRKIGSVGFPMKASVAKLIADDGAEISADGVVGELVLSGDHVCMGYYGREEEYKKTCSGGFFKTGDYALRDADGYYYIVGRKKEMFISGGENVYPKEIEDRLTMLPEVLECAVVGVADAKWGEVGLAAITLRGEHFANLNEVRESVENQIRDHLKKYLASYKIPKKIKFYDSLPKNAVGKIDKKVLKEEYLKEKGN